MLRVLLDANQLVSSVLSASGIQGRILDAWRRQAFLLFVAPGQVDEVAEVLSRPKIAKKYSVTPDDRDALVALLDGEALLLPDAPPAGVCRDPDDDYLLGCAAARAVDYLVTGDNALLAVGQRPIMDRRIDIPLPDETRRMVGRAAAKGDRSQFIAAAVRYDSTRTRSGRLRKRLEDGAARRAARDRALAEDWIFLEEEAWCRPGP